MNFKDAILYKSIYDIFGINLQKKPDSTFTRSEIDGKAHYKRYFEPRECGVFHELEIIEQGETYQNAIFQGIEPWNRDELCSTIMKITTALYSIFGQDDYGNGVFSLHEIEDYNHGTFHRSYNLLESDGMFIELYNKDFMLCLSIMGISIK